MLLCSDNESGVIVLFRLAALRAFRVVAACTNFGTKRELSRSETPTNVCNVWIRYKEPEIIYK